MLAERLPLIRPSATFSPTGAKAGQRGLHKIDMSKNGLQPLRLNTPSTTPSKISRIGRWSAPAEMIRRAARLI